MNYQNYPNYDLGLLLFYQQEIEYIQQEIGKINGVPLSLKQKIYYLEMQINSHIYHIQTRGQRIVPQDGD